MKLYQVMGKTTIYWDVTKRAETMREAIEAAEMDWLNWTTSEEVDTEDVVELEDG